MSYTFIIHFRGTTNCAESDPSKKLAKEYLTVDLYRNTYIGLVRLYKKTNAALKGFYMNAVLIYRVMNLNI